MRRSICVGMFLALLFLTSALPSQTPWATLSQPPVGTAAPGDILSAGHLGREIGNVELMIHFYYDLLGLKINGAPQPAKALRFKRNRARAARVCSARRGSS